ncbi:subtilisin-like protein [Lojkania enalia]|uniref:Subtilisin-like protein n=1 Tax=Lojkania enalia TaxID=147567 RepID=A0A9P4TQI2_9PLEO|nr:subtilisin-like protein [Didymosphaeria enalia]
MRQIWQRAIESEGKDSTRYRGFDPKCYVQNPLRSRTVASNGEPEKKRDAQYEQRELWMDCMKTFATFIQNYEVLGTQPVIKVALIDDGVDSYFDDLDQSIKEGQSYSLRDRDLGLWNPYYHSANGHGTVMAMLIRQMCPKVQLYVAKLNEIATQDTNQITASSAVKAINWAREMGVHIISMSWSIDKITNQNDARDLQKAVDDAIAAGILLFCASDDQGNSRPEDVDTYPGKCNAQRIFRIGAATRAGHQGEWVRGVHYILPGEKDQLIPSFGDQLSGHEPRTASSLATALGSGLAALILYCAALNDKSDFELLKTQEKMNAAFKNLCKSQLTGNQYLHVREVFGKYLPKGGVGDDEETENKKAIEQIVSHLLRE